jgi:hypothetical protein
MPSLISLSLSSGEAGTTHGHMCSPLWRISQSGNASFLGSSRIKTMFELTRVTPHGKGRLCTSRAVRNRTLIAIHTHRTLIAISPSSNTASAHTCSRFIGGAGLFSRSRIFPSFPASDPGRKFLNQIRFKTVQRSPGKYINL